MAVPMHIESTLAATDLIDSDHADVREFAVQHCTGPDMRSRAVSLYYAVRDGFRYDPYRIDLSPSGMRASSVIANGYAWCVPKAALLAAACRASGIPARLGYADVRNHLSTARLREVLGTDLFIWHGYTDILLDGRWVKATPAFNIELCERFGLHALEFDGRNDSIYHAFDKSGHRHMEYVRMRGAFDDMPLANITQDFQNVYHGMMTRLGEMRAADFRKDVDAENRPADGTA